jgi:hypothetical protein
MALRQEDVPGDCVWERSLELYELADPAGWDARRKRGEARLPQLAVLTNAPWTDFRQWKWTSWDKWLRRFSLGFMRHPTKREQMAAARYLRGQRGRCVVGDPLIVRELVHAACELAGLSERQTEIWIRIEGHQVSQAVMAKALGISQPMTSRHLANARARLARQWQRGQGVIGAGLVIEGTSRRCAWRFRGFDCRVRCQQKEFSSQEVVHERP